MQAINWVSLRPAISAMLKCLSSYRIPSKKFVCLFVCLFVCFCSVLFCYICCCCLFVFYPKLMLYVYLCLSFHFQKLLRQTQWMLNVSENIMDFRIFDIFFLILRIWRHSDLPWKLVVHILVDMERGQRFKHMHQIEYHKPGS